MKSNWKSAVFSVKKSKTFKIMRLLMIFVSFSFPESWRMATRRSKLFPSICINAT